jgi:hypothetical protein
MSAHVDQFGDSLRDRLNAIEERIQIARHNILILPEQGEKAMRQRLDEARTGLQAQQQRVERTMTNMQTRAQEKLAETREKVGEWKARREVRKLKTRADRAEAYAADVIDFAVVSIDQAEEAVLDAVLARHDADTAQ